MAHPKFKEANFTDIPVEELPALLERVRPRLAAADYQQIEQWVRIIQQLDELHLLGLPPEELEAALEAADRRLRLEAEAAERKSGAAGNCAGQARGSLPN